MKKMRKLLALLLTVGTVVSVVTGCGPRQNETQLSENIGGSETSSAISEPVAKPTQANDLDQDWSGDSIVVQDLGNWVLDAFPVDASYDWGSCILNIDGVYKMWWTRSSPWDGVWYAESTDLKHWTNIQIVYRLRSVK